MALGTTYDHNLTRDEILSLMFEMLGVIAMGDSLSGEQVDRGTKILNNIIRELSDSGKHIWARSTPQYLVLGTNQWVYSTADGLQGDIRRLVSVFYRNTAAEDDAMELYRSEDWEGISNKFDTGDPVRAYFEESLTLTSQKLHIHPAPNSQNTQERVTGTDSNQYYCIKSHTAITDWQPTTGENWQLFWALTDTSGGTWTAGSDYSAQKTLRYVYEKPLFDFDTSTDTAHLPPSYLRYILNRGCYDLSPFYGIPHPEREIYRRDYKEAFEEIFRSRTQETTTKKNRSFYY